MKTRTLAYAFVTSIGFVAIASSTYLLSQQWRRLQGIEEGRHIVEVLSPAIKFVDALAQERGVYNQALVSRTTSYDKITAMLSDRNVVTNHLFAETLTQIQKLPADIRARIAGPIVQARQTVLGARDEASPFPWAEIALQGDVEALTRERPAIEAEQAYRETLSQERGRDAAAGRTLIGPHLSDLAVRHGPKAAPAAQCSTGEQKALLVGLVLGQAQVVSDMSGIAPLALLDEVAAHFDPRRRAALFEALTRIGGQVFVTGADPRAFEGLSARLYDVAGGRVTARPDQA